MQTISSLEALAGWVGEVRAAGQTIGFVPTMGYLHDATCR